VSNGEWKLVQKLRLAPRIYNFIFENEKTIVLNHLPGV